MIEDDHGPRLPSRLSVHLLAGELLRSAQLVRELSGIGPTADLSRAVGELDKMRALLGPAAADGSEHV